MTGLDLMKKKAGKDLELMELLLDWFCVCFQKGKDSFDGVEVYWKAQL